MSVIRTCIQALSLLALWLLLSGHYEPLLVAFGIVSSTAIALLAGRLGLNTRDVGPGFYARLPGYLPWLANEIVKSNIDVTRRIWRRTPPISPGLIEIDASQTTELGLTVYANSITLTPGTLSVETEPGRIQVHALAGEIAAGMSGGEMDRRVRRLEGVD